MNRRTLASLPVSELRGKRVLLRVDFNVPLDGGMNVTDDTRIRATLPTLRLLADAGARVVVISHLGRPKGERLPKYSLRPAAERLAELLDVQVDFVGETVGAQMEAAVRELRDGDVVVLENTRFLAGEEDNDPALAEALAGVADLYVNDAFGAAHRAHASTAGVAEAVRARGGSAVAGLLMARELAFLGGALDRPERPFVAVLGGAKISGKLDVIDALLPKTDRLLIGGAMANTFFRAMGLETGRSLVEEDRVELARRLVQEAGDRLLLPRDVRVAPALAEGAEVDVVARDSIPPDRMALDIGPATVRTFAAQIARARTVLWNGPLGVFETPAFAEGTRGVAEAVANATDTGATTIVGGGDSAAAVAELGLSDRVTHVSTGGGASLEFLEGRTLPGVAALDPADA
ncbi:MAG: phosphoglycerate kinase [Gemmatimonadota bacterium]|nr:phosphoglycerate kinase [Gemmatimonadota bacterium]